MSDADGYIIEFHQVGANIKVTAVDPVTMIEVSIVGGTGYSQEFLTRQAVKKLEFMLAKHRESAK